MLECNSIGYNRIDISEGIDFNKTNPSKKVIFVTTVALKILVLSMSLMFVMAIMI